MNELQINENLMSRNTQTFKDNFTNTLYKRPFLIEKIKKDIYRGKKYNLLKMDNSDKLLLKLKKNLKKKVKKMNPISSNISESNNFDKIYEFYEKDNNNLQIELIKKKINIIPTKRILIKQRSAFDLPMINSRKIRKVPLNKNNDKTKISSKENPNPKNHENISKSEIINIKDLYNNKPRTIKIRSFMNTSLKSDLSINNESKIYNINEINEKFNMKLKIDNKSKPPNRIFHGKKYTIKGMLNKLFEYYSSNEIHNNPLSTNANNQTSNNINNSKSNNSIFINNETNDIKNSSINDIKIDKKLKNDNNSSSEININNTFEANGEDTNTFLTKLNINNNNKFDIKEKNIDRIKLFNSKRSMSEVNRRNKEIIDNNNDIKMDCLISKIDQNINIKKILYKYLGKSIYELQKDPAYIRLKNLEKKLIEILKKEEK